ncbi:MAG TPA: serine/threonine-protein kinase [Acidobacteriota bacterium]|nr:serine/threonine-protein kinase [Acidobacteriota bacterium]
MPSSEMATVAAPSSPPAKLPSKPRASPEAPSAAGSSRAFSLSQSMGRFTPGTVFAERYRIIGLLGKGGMGEVYRADDLTLDQPVALKFLPEKVAGDPERLERFYSEVRIARQVSHPNVCRIYDVGQVQGQHFISMEYVDGEDLASLLRRIGRLPQDKALEIARQMCAGLAAAHEKSVLHRDLKPGNIMIDGLGKARLADFGLARTAEDVRDSNEIEGTPAYMAPEQFAGRAATIKSDLYSLGLVLYELFTGKPAFKAGGVTELARLHRDSNPTNPSALVPDIDPIVERVILRCLEKDPTARPSSALAVSAALPGGDPLAAALAAGETPSPEMVAAAGDEGALSRVAAWAGLGYILITLSAIVLLSGRTSLLNWIPQTKSSSALAERSVELIPKMGYTQEALDSAYGYEETDFLGQLAKAADRAEQLKLGEPPGLVFWYRQSPKYLTSESFFAAGDTRADSPSQDQPNMVALRLDTEGRLVKFEAVPPRTDSTAAEKTKPDWNAIFLEAGFDLAKFTSAAPHVVPPVYADSRLAWEGTYPQRSDLTIRVEAAGAQGKCVYFEVFQPWNFPSRSEKSQEGLSKKVVSLAILILLLAVLGGTFLLAWRNLKLNRGDRRGAWRLSISLFLLETAGRVLQAHWVPDLGESIGLSWMIVSRSLMFAALIWVGYIALEPHIRRLWPHTMISWSRLLVGHLSDPRIGRDLLLGGAFGLTIPLLDELTYLVVTKLGYPMTPALASAHSINSIAPGVPHFLGSLSTYLTTAVSVALYLSLFLFLLRLILRKEWLAVTVFVGALIVDSSRNSTNPVVAVCLSLVLYSGLTLILKRFGLVAVVSCIVFLNVPERTPITAHFGIWYSNASVFVLLLLAGLAVYGFRIALAGKPAFAFDLLE